MRTIRVRILQGLLLLLTGIFILAIHFLSPNCIQFANWHLCSLSIIISFINIKFPVNFEWLFPGLLFHLKNEKKNWKQFVKLWAQIVSSYLAIYKYWRQLIEMSRFCTGKKVLLKSKLKRCLMFCFSSTYINISEKKSFDTNC